MWPQLESLDSAARSILVVDDDPAMCRMLEEVLTQEGYRALVCLRPEDALAISGQDSFQLAFVDIHMPGMSGLDLAAKLKEDHADREVVFRFLGRLRLILPATTLGDVYSLVLYPAMSSHRSLPPETRRSLGIGDGLVRLSVGIEDPADILADLASALEDV